MEQGQDPIYLVQTGIIPMTQELKTRLIKIRLTFPKDKQTTNQLT